MHKLKLSVPILTVLALALSAGCAPQAAPTAEPVSLTVSAAASLTEAFSEIGTAFSAENPNVTVTFNFAGSQELAQQIVQGAKVDVFASANQKQMDVVLTGLNVTPEAAAVFAKNRLVVVFPTVNEAGLKTLTDLANPGLKIVLAGAEVPVGQYSLDFLDKAAASGTFPVGFKDAALQNVVSYEQNVRAVLTKVSLDEADAGIVYTTDIGAARDQVGTLDVPDELNVIASYPILALPESQQAAAAQAFAEFVLSPAGQEILAKYGFAAAE